MLGGGATNDGIDKVDNGGGVAGTPMQVNYTVMNQLLLLLVFALKKKTINLT